MFSFLSIYKNERVKCIDYPNINRHYETSNYNRNGNVWYEMIYDSLVVQNIYIYSYIPTIVLWVVIEHCTVGCSENEKLRNSEPPSADMLEIEEL